MAITVDAGRTPSRHRPGAQSAPSRDRGPRGSLYDVLGVAPDASCEEIRHAYLAKAARLEPARYEGAPASVREAVDKAAAVVDQAGRVLGDEESRAAYDRALAQDGSDWRDRAEHVWAMERELGWPPQPVFGMAPPVAPLPAAPGTDRPAAAGAEAPAGLGRQPSTPSEDGDVTPVLAGLEALANWLAPHPRAARTVTVPDVCGQRASDAFYTVATADLQIDFVRLTEPAERGEGLVVDQDPRPGTTVRRHSKLTVFVVYGAGDPAEAVEQA